MKLQNNRYFIFTSLFLSFLVFNFASATTSAPVAPQMNLNTISNNVLVASVNIQNGQILSQDGNTFKIQFSLTNGEGLQSGVRYGVQLVSKTNAGQIIIIDEKVYDEVLTLSPNSSTAKNIIYTAPEMLGGKYMLLLTSKNDRGFSFGISFVKEVTLARAGTGLAIAPESCALTVSGEKDKKYTLIQGVDISKDEVLTLTCSAENLAKKSISVMPTFEMRDRSAYGKIVEQAVGSAEAIKFASSEKKTFSVTLPKGLSPQAYNLQMKFGGEAVISNTISLQYLIRGTSASIINLFFDKDYYKRNDTAKMALLYTSSASFSGVREKKGSTIQGLLLTAVMTNDKGDECSKAVERELKRDVGKPQMSFLLSVERDCYNPKVEVSIKDNQGNVYDQRTFSVVTKSIPVSQQNQNKGTSKVLPIFLTIVVLAIIFGFIRNKKSNVQ